MADNYIKKALHEVVKEYYVLGVKADLNQRKALEIERQRFALLPKIHALAELEPPRPDSAVARLVKRIAKSGLTAAVGNILEGTGKWMSPSQIRDEMIRFRVDLRTYKNPVSSIHTILRRWADSGAVEEGKDPKTGKSIFRWKMPHMWDEADLSDATTEQIAQYMLDPPKTTRKRSRSKKSRAQKDEPLLLTEGSSEVN